MFTFFSCLFVFLAFCLHFQLFVYNFICMSTFLAVCLHVQLFVYIFSYLFTFSAVCLYLTVYLHFSCLFLFLAVCLHCSCFTFLEEKFSFVLSVCFESIGRWLFEKNWFLNAILRLQIFPMTSEADVENVENWCFVSMSCGLTKFTSLREVKIILCPTY